MFKAIKTFMTTGRVAAVAGVIIALLGAAAVYQKLTADNLKEQIKGLNKDIAVYEATLDTLDDFRTRDAAAQTAVLHVTRLNHEKKAAAHARIQAAQTDCAVDPDLADIFARVPAQP